MTTVEFCRINRRLLENSLGMRSFAEDMEILATQGRDQLRAKVRKQEFIAADLSITSDGHFMIGTLGFAEDETIRAHDDEAFSWVKGPTTEVHGAKRETVVPFAIDLREYRRWCAYATTSRIRTFSFQHNFEVVLNAAVGKLELMPSRWEVDPVMSLTDLAEWLVEHPEVVVIRRVMKLTNPLSDVDEARRKMRALAAPTYKDELKASRNTTLDTNNSVFDEHVSGIQTGDVMVELEARIPGARGRVKYKSEEHRERTTIPDFGSNLELGMEQVLRVLAEFSERKGDVVHEAPVLVVEK